MAEGSVRSLVIQSTNALLPKSERQFKDGPLSAPSARQDSFDYSSSSSKPNRGLRNDVLDKDYQTLNTSSPHRPSSIASQGSRHSPENFMSSFSDGASSIKGWQDTYTWQAECMNPMLLLSPSSQKGTRVTSTLSRKLDAAEATIRELKEEVLTWEMHAHKLDVEAEMLRQQLSSELKSGAELRKRISSLESERDSLKVELAQLRTPAFAPIKLEDVDDYSNSDLDKTQKMIKTLEEEITYEREVHASLHLQLQRTQDSNSQLVSLVTELEACLELRNEEISELVEIRKELENQLDRVQCPNAIVLQNAVDSEGRADNETNNDLSEILETLRKLMQDGNADNSVDHNELTDASFGLLQKLQKANRQVDANVKLIALLEASVEKLSRSEPPGKPRNTWNDKQDFVDDSRMQVKKQKKQDHIDDLRMQVKILGNRNNLLDCQLIEAKNEIALLGLEAQALQDQKGHSQTHVTEFDSQVPLLLDEIKLLKVSAGEFQSSKLQLEMEKAEMQEMLREAHDENRATAGELKYLKLQLEMEKAEMQEKLREAYDENRVANKRLNESAQQMAALSTTLDTQTVAQSTLHSRALQLEMEKEELRTQVAQLEEENIKLLERVTSAEAELNCVLEESKLLKVDMRNIHEKALQELQENHQMKLGAYELEMQGKLHEAQDVKRAANERFNELVQQMAALSTTFEAQLMAPSILKSRALQLGTEKEDHQAQVAHLEEENLQLLEIIASVEAELNCVLEERELLKADIKTFHEKALQGFQEDHQMNLGVFEERSEKTDL
ncbi:hypothetical protein L7F22_068612 [Adiantum nelumboides]|nr:hypothetical protein [Adiantum nelumboides]